MAQLSGAGCALVGEGVGSGSGIGGHGYPERLDRVGRATIGMPVEVVFDEVSESVTPPRFRPRRSRGFPTP